MCLFSLDLNILAVDCVLRRLPVRPEAILPACISDLLRGFSSSFCRFLLLLCVVAVVPVVVVVVVVVIVVMKVVVAVTVVVADGKVVVVVVDVDVTVAVVLGPVGGTFEVMVVVLQCLLGSHA